MPGASSYAPRLQTDARTIWQPPWCADLPTLRHPEALCPPLHFDLRLEIEGVLVSWAVTKGPSLDPRVRRLAVRTEDHPLEYADFEGTIPEGQYGAGTVEIWDRGTFTPRQDIPVADALADGHLKFRLDGERLRGGFALVRTQADKAREQWLLIKEKDAFASNAFEPAETWIGPVDGPAGRYANAGPPAFCKPQLATAVDPGAIRRKLGPRDQVRRLPLPGHQGRRPRALVRAFRA